MSARIEGEVLRQAELDAHPLHDVLHGAKTERLRNARFNFAKDHGNAAAGHFRQNLLGFL
ncbi:hypothetical protein AAE026_13030 [Bradyrhizobium sp. DN5]|uniref:hypothetical protein n=1 Tax=Bradyrhizobium sp. DN5 TaxID=3056950 RepID=UPI003525E6D5